MVAAVVYDSNRMSWCTGWVTWCSGKYFTPITYIQQLAGEIGQRVAVSDEHQPKGALLQLQTYTLAQDVHAQIYSEELAYQ